MREKPFRLVVILILVGLIVTCNAFNPLGKKNDDKSSSESSSVDLSQLEESTQILIVNAAWATISALEAAILTHEAVGNKEKAEQLSDLVAKVKDDPYDDDNLKTSVEESNNAIEELQNIELEAKIEKQEAQEKLAKAFLDLGIAVIFDKKVVEIANAQSKQHKAAMKQLKKKPLENRADIKKVKGMSETTAFLSSNIPDQMKIAAALSQQIMNYAKTHDLKLPSDKEIQKAATDMEKQ